MTTRGDTPWAVVVLRFDHDRDRQAFERGEGNPLELLMAGLDSAD
jgi:hypothetical protein